MDMDDNGPEFDAERFRLRVAENQPSGTEVRPLVTLTMPTQHYRNMDLDCGYQFYY